MALKYEVCLKDEEREDLKEMLSFGMHTPRELKRAYGLLFLDKGVSRVQTAWLLDVNSTTISTLARLYATEGLEGALFDKPRSGQPPKITAKEEALITAIACQKPPEGSSRWTLAMIRDQLLVLCEHIETLSCEAVRKVLKKTNSNRGSRSRG